MSYVTWDKDPLVLQRKSGGYLMIVGGMLYRFSYKGMLEKAEQLTDSVLGIVMQATPDSKASPLWSTVSAKMRANRQQERLNAVQTQ